MTHGERHEESHPAPSTNTAKPSAGPVHTTALLRQLLDNPHLPAYIANLDTPTLHKLVSEIGKEDAQELIAFATPAQVKDLIETEAWQPETPGAEEKFDPARFLEWLTLWEDMDESFLTDQLRGIGSDLFALALDAYTVVIDIHAVGLSGDADVFSNYAVLPKDDSSWPTMQHLLSVVWDEDPDFIESALATCCRQRSLLSENTTIAASDVLETDVASDRDQHRQSLGHVTPLSASVFLGAARTASIDDLIIDVAYDPIAASYLASARKLRQEDDPGDATDSNGAREQPDTQTEDESGRQAISALLASVNISPAAPSARLLAGPGAAGELYLKEALRSLGERNAEAMALRLDEIVYLANILVAGTTVQGGQFSEAEAVKCVYATCNLGITYCLEEDPFDEEARMRSAFLEEEPGLIKAFRIGYHLIGQLPHKAIVAMVRELSSKPVQGHLRNHPWVQEQIGHELALSDLGAELDHERLEKVRSLIDTLALVFDSNACEQLRAMIDPVPCFPRSLEMNAPPQIRVNKRKRYLREPRDLRGLLTFLDDLEGRFL